MRLGGVALCRRAATKAQVSHLSQIVEESRENVGAGVMGRNMLGPVGGGDWGDGRWKGWWGDDPPYHYDVFVVTHHPREPVAMRTARHTTSSPTGSSARRSGQRRPRTARTSCSGAALRSSTNTWRRAISTSLSFTSFPCCVGGGARLFDDLDGAKIELEQVRAVEAPGVTHVKYGVRT